MHGFMHGTPYHTLTGSGIPLPPPWPPPCAGCNSSLYGAIRVNKLSRPLSCGRPSPHYLLNELAREEPTPSKKRNENDEKNKSEGNNKSEGQPDPTAHQSARPTSPALLADTSPAGWITCHRASKHGGVANNKRSHHSKP